MVRSRRTRSATCRSGDRSNVQLVGTFIQHLKLGGPGGPLDPFGTRIYALVE